MQNPFRYFNSSPEVISLAVMLYIRYPLSLRGIVTLTESGQQRTASTPIQVAALALSHTSKALVRNLLKVGLLSK